MDKAGPRSAAFTRGYGVADVAPSGAGALLAFALPLQFRLAFGFLAEDSLFVPALTGLAVALAAAAWQVCSARMLWAEFGGWRGALGFGVAR
ncbi:hypothetical protein DDT48_20950 [Mycobacteroides abscessus]|nr:hypothetical protein DDT48_20950 [Mycobacteroides abscessus]RIU09633.1 hypothetical protein D2E94_11010 [Mycobacteroides abscessus]